tara:strand:+ start:103 stop:360 length:258 start_codon:yes stop_codon:yes gene_type:complete
MRQPTNKEKKKMPLTKLQSGSIKKGIYLFVERKKFKGNHIHSIVKKKRPKNEKLERDYPEVWSDFSLEVVDKTILMRDFELDFKI